MMKFNPLLYILAIFGLIHIFEKIEHTKQSQSNQTTSTNNQQIPKEIQPHKIDFNTPIYKTKDIT